MFLTRGLRLDLSFREGRGRRSGSDRSGAASEAARRFSDHWGMIPVSSEVSSHCGAKGGKERRRLFDCLEGGDGLANHDGPILPFHA